MTAPARRKLTVGEFAHLWDKAREDVALLMAATVETQQRLHELIGIQRDMYEGLLGEEAPDLEIQPKIIRERAS